MHQEIDGLNIHYQTIGRGKPIFFLHGYWAEGEQMIGFLEPTMSQRQGWQRIYIDLPGMGRTPGPNSIENSDQVLDVINKFINTILPDGTFTIGGYSYGGYIAQGLAARRPERVDGLFTVCPVTIGEVKQRTLPKESPLLTEEIVINGRKEDLPFLERLRYFGYAFSFELWPDGKTFDKPTLILTGRQDHAVGYHDAYGIMKHFPRGTYAALDQAGHGLPADQPRLFKALVSEWLDRVEQNTASS
jgi:pimeloyl-ACP methyl ester carboxylesterase